MSLEIINKMVYAGSEEAYQVHYNELKNTKLKPVLSYFDANWHNIRQEWVEGLKGRHKNLLNSTNNRVESINQKLKTVRTKYTGIVQFFRDMLKCINSLNIERNHRAVSIFQKVPITTSVKDFIRYQEVLTPYAMNLVSSQYKYSSECKIAQIIDDTNATFQSKEGIIATGLTGCQCNFFSSTALPCRHIFAFRKIKNAPPFA